MATAMGYIPRIAGGDMSQYDGKMVTLMAQVVSDDGNVATTGSEAKMVQPTNCEKEKS